MMRIAIAGGGGLGYLLASGLSSAETALNVVVLSRSERHEFAELDVQVHVVDYNSYPSLSFALQGIDLVISTISGQEQLNLINAAGHGNVRHFVPSEFEGPLSRRPSQEDPLDRGSSEALALLRQWSRASRKMRYTVFSCGVLMERFYGLGKLNMGFGEGVPDSGDYLIDISNAAAEYTEKDARGHTVRICLTSVYDLVSFVVAAVEMGLRSWPHEWTMYGDRLTVRDVVGSCSSVLNVAFVHERRQYAQLATAIQYYTQMEDFNKAAYYQRLLATANGRYDFGRATLNEAVNASDAVSVQPVTFAQWLANMWQTNYYLQGTE